MHKKLLTLILNLAMVTQVCAMEPMIEPYHSVRDRPAVVKILHDNYDYLTYESMGSAPGTTEKYLTSPNYITDVVRVEDKTVGFINYAAWDMTFLTFNFGRRGVVHLMGIDKEYQQQGLGRLLFRYAVQKLKMLNTPTIMLSAKTDNTKAIGLYTQEGFVPAPSYIPMKDTIFTFNVDVPADKLPAGNIIQRHPKTFLALSVPLIAGLLYLKYRYG